MKQTNLKPMTPVLKAYHEIKDFHKRLGLLLMEIEAQLPEGPPTETARFITNPLTGKTDEIKQRG